MTNSKTIYVLDEAGVYLNSRSFKDIDPAFHHALAQGRHDSYHLHFYSVTLSIVILKNLRITLFIGSVFICLLPEISEYLIVKFLINIQVLNT